jgi:preprotein translocase subunit SecD
MQATSRSRRPLFIALGLLVILAFCCLVALCSAGLLALVYAWQTTHGPTTTIFLAPDAAATVTPESLNPARQVVQKRLESAGMTGVKVTVEGSRLRVELAGHVDVSAVGRLCTDVGALAFWDSTQFIPTGTTMPSDARIILTDADIAEARLVQTDSRWQVAVAFTPAGTKTLADYTQANIGHYLVIAWDGVALSSPVVQSAITEGKAVITGQFDADSARSFAAQLNGGRLPFKLVVVETRKNS